jgi:hypothetical protein
MALDVKCSVRHRMQAAAEALLPGMPAENLGLLARDVAGLAQAVLVREGTALTSPEQEELSRAVEASAERFLSHLSRRSTAELWESFAVPWDYAGTLARVRSGQYAAALLDDAQWALAQTVTMFGPAPLRTSNAARKSARVLLSVAAAALMARGGPVAGMTDSQVAFIAAMALAGAALPLFVLQIGMQQTAPLTVAMLASAVPGLTYLAAAIAGNQRFDVVSFVLITASIGLAFLGPIVLKRVAKAEADLLSAQVA